MVYRWLYTYCPIFCIESVSKLSRPSVSPSTDHKFASSLSVNCHDRRFHRLPTISLHRASSLSVNCHEWRRSVSPSTDHQFASILSVNCHDRRYHRLPTIICKLLDGRRWNRRSWQSTDELDARYWEVGVKSPINHRSNQPGATLHPWRKYLQCLSNI